MRDGVQFKGYGIVIGREDGDLVGDATLNHGGALSDDHDPGRLHPGVDDFFNRMGSAAVEVFDLFFRELGLTFKDDLVSVAVLPDLDDVDLFSGQDHAAVGEEADAVRIRGTGRVEAPQLMVIGGVGIGLAMEEGGSSAVRLHAGAFEPGVSAERDDHLIEQDLATLGRGSGPGWDCGAVQVGGLCIGRL